MASRRDGRDDQRLFWLRRLVDSEGEVLDMLVQRGRNKAAAIKLVRKLLKKQGFAPELLAGILQRCEVAARPLRSS
jgi:transposase-like protein